MTLPIRLPALVAVVALLSSRAPVEAHAAPRRADTGPCQIYCDAMYSLCMLFGGGYLCSDMRDGCRFGCNLKVT